MSSIQPSYKQGYARSASESANPGLWKGLQGLWHPGLGPTGLTLRDVSGRRNHGTFTNMDPATDWVMTEKGYVLDYGAAINERVDLGTTTFVSKSSPWSVAALVWLDSYPNAFPGIVRFKVDDNAQNWRLNFSNNGAYQPITFGAQSGFGRYRWDATGSAGPTNQWVHIVVTYNGTGAATIGNYNLYLDGLSVGLTTAGGFGNDAATSAIGIQADLEWDGKIGGVGVWSRVLTPSEIQLLYVDPDAIVRLRRRVYAAAVVAGNRRRRMILFGAGV